MRSEILRGRGVQTLVKTIDSAAKAKHLRLLSTCSGVLLKLVEDSELDAASSLSLLGGSAALKAAFCVAEPGLRAKLERITMLLRYPVETRSFRKGYVDTSPSHMTPKWERA